MGERRVALGGLTCIDMQGVYRARLLKDRI